MDLRGTNSNSGAVYLYTGTGEAFRQGLNRPVLKTDLLNKLFCDRSLIWAGSVRVLVRLHKGRYRHCKQVLMCWSEDSFNLQPCTQDQLHGLRAGTTDRQQLDC